LLAHTRWLIVNVLTNLDKFTILVLSRKKVLYLAAKLRYPALITNVVRNVVVS